MSNNKQSSLDYYITKLTEILGPEIIKQISRDDNERIARLEKQAKAMHHKEVVDFVEDWYCNGPLLGGGVDVAATIEEHYNETFGGNNEQQ
jgi:hypothetical protein